jgi:ATP/maltotriose-dependent transcriptional regulator MalT
MTVCWFGGGAPSCGGQLEKAVDQFGSHAPVVLSLCCRIFCNPAQTSDADLTSLTRTIAMLDTETDPVRIVRTGMAAFFVDRVEDCRDAHWRVVRDGRKGGAVTAAIDALIHLALDDYNTGRWDEALELAEEGLAICSTHGYRVLAWPLHLARALVCAGRGEDAIVSGVATEMAGWAAPRRAQAIAHYASYLRAVMALGRGDFEDSFRNASTISPPGVLAAHVPLGVWSMMLLVESATRSGHAPQAAAHVQAMERSGVERLSPRLALLVAASRAMVTPDDEASRRYEEAVAIPGAGRWPFDLARVRLSYGEHLRRTGQMRSARAQLEPALATFDHLRAEPWAETARRELRATGRVRARAR